jgi:hypothetical protein
LGLNVAKIGPERRTWMSFRPNLIFLCFSQLNMLEIHFIPKNMSLLSAFLNNDQSVMINQFRLYKITNPTITGISKVVNKVSCYLRSTVQTRTMSKRLHRFKIFEMKRGSLLLLQVRISVNSVKKTKFNFWKM